MLKRRQLDRWFPDDEIVTVPDAVLPAGITDPDTRRALTDMGVPESFQEVLETNVDLPERIRTVGQTYRDLGEPVPDGADDLYLLGNAGQSLLAVDGRTGAVRQVHTSFGTRPMASGLEAFVRLLGAVSTEVRRRSRDDLGERLRAKLPGWLRELDPPSAPAAEPAWSAFLADVAANAE
ncbi:SUKH-4 family immunity protein [Micromonospora zhanjiangensis]|uniref:SUKH-4 family immunity protein n=1 Tax=Micromonospora zhanjiangensis TaxID=1522057 RepID=A0ABV8KPX2_9ACTN